MSKTNAKGTSAFLRTLLTPLKEWYEATWLMCALDKSVTESEDFQSAVQRAIDEAVDGLKKKNAELLAKLERAKPDAEKIAAYDKLHADFEALKTENDATKAKLKETTKALDLSKADLVKVSSAFDTSLVEGGLADALASANIDPALMPAVKALLGRDAKVVLDGESRKAVIGDKPIAEYVKTWTQSEQGKPFVKAPTSGGGGGGGGGNGGGGGKMTAAPVRTDAKYAGAQGEIAYFRDAAAWSKQNAEAA